MTPAEIAVVAEFRAQVGTARLMVANLEKAIWKKYRSFGCNYAGKLFSDNTTSYAALNLALPVTCEGRLEAARELYSALDRLESIAIAPGFAPGDPPNVPIIFVRPQDVVSTTTTIIESTAEQVRIQARWANRTDLQIAADAFEDGMAKVLADAGQVAGRVAGKAAQKALDAAANQLKQGEFPWFVAIAGTVLIGGIWMATRRIR